jgi:hypothetical protein
MAQPEPSFRQGLKNLFQKPASQWIPTENEEKWYVIGWFMAIVLFFILLMPLFLWSQLISTYIPLYPAIWRISSVIPMLGWLLVVYLRRGKLIDFSHNVSVLFWIDFQRDKEKNRLKNLEKTA